MKRRRFSFIIAFILFGFLFYLRNAYAFFPSQEVEIGNSLYEDGDYEGSIEKYNAALKEEPESDIINYNIGTTYYQLGEYEKAIDHLQKALLTEAPELKEKVLYNLGNALYRMGLEKEDADLNIAIDSLEGSLNHLDRSVKVKDAEKVEEDAKFNSQVVTEDLKRLREKLAMFQDKQQQQQQQGQQNEQDNQNQSQSDQDDRSQQQDQSQQQNSGDSQDPEGDPSQQDGQDNDTQDQNDGEQNQDKDGQNDLNDIQPDQPDHESDRPPSSGQGQPSPREMTQREAEMFIDDYQQNEEAQGLLNYLKRKGKELPVLKDW